MKCLLTRFFLVLLTSLISVAILVPSASAQDRGLDYRCPVFSVACPAGCPKPNQNVVFRGHINFADPTMRLIFIWSVFNGEIISGTSTDTLTVRIDNPCQSITAKLDIAGLPPDCSRTASCTTVTDCCGFAPVARKTDEFGDINCEEEMAHLDMFAVQLNNEPGSSAYVVFYGGRSYKGRLARRGESEARAGRIKKYLAERRGIDAGRVLSINGGYRARWSAELWIAPMGATPPAPTPTLKPQDIKFRRGKIGKHEYNCAL